MTFRFSGPERANRRGKPGPALAARRGLAAAFAIQALSGVACAALFLSYSPLGKGASPSVNRPTPPSSSHPHGEIMAVAEVAALEAARSEGLVDVEVRVRPLDARLRPARCDQPLEMVRPNSGSVLGPVSYGVQCSGSVPWTLYLRADVSASIDVPVLNRSMARGEVISARDIDVIKRRITTRSADLIVDSKRLVGMEVIRPMVAGSMLRQGQVDYPVVVTRGQTVTLIAGGRGLEVRMQGKAMASGSAGDRLIVTNTNSGRRVEGIVQSDGSVQIP